MQTTFDVSTDTTRLQLWTVASALLFLATSASATCAPYVENHPNWHGASLRLHTTAFEHCPMDEATYQRVVAQWLAQKSASARFDSLSLGRAVGHPWLSRYLATKALNDPQWRRIARTDPGKHNAYVSRLLSQAEMLRRFDRAFAGSDYAVFAVSVEKVLVGPASEYADVSERSQRRVPFDAQIWLRLRPRSEPHSSTDSGANQHE